jgi:hypothetical protein
MLSFFRECLNPVILKPWDHDPGLQGWLLEMKLTAGNMPHGQKTCATLSILKPITMVYPQTQLVYSLCLWVLRHLNLVVFCG